MVISFEKEKICEKFVRNHKSGGKTPKKYRLRKVENVERVKQKFRKIKNINYFKSFQQFSHQKADFKIIWAKK